MELTYGEKVKLDSKDKLIVEQLQKNCRQSIAQISKKTRLPRDVVMYRIRRMEDLNVIRGHHTFLDPTKLGFPLYAYILLSCYNIAPKEEASLVAWLKENPQIVYVAKNSGRWDFTLGVCAREYRDFDELIRSIRHKFANAIREIEQLPTIQEYKFDWMADLVGLK